MKNGINEEARKRLKFSVMHLPLRFLSESIDQTSYPKVKVPMLMEKLYLAPKTGTLLISGTAGPVVQHFMEQGRECAGMSFVEYYASKLEGNAERPPKGDVVVLYGVGNEAAKSADYSSKLLEGILDWCKNHEVLLVVETPMPITSFLTRYGIDFPNTLSLKLKQESSWI